MEFIIGLNLALKFKIQSMYATTLTDHKKNYLIISKEKVFDKTQPPCLVKVFSKLRLEGNFFNSIKSNYLQKNCC